jgi:glycosyltransferase involved in cell wall biosynthesis
VSVAGLVKALARDGRWTPIVAAPVAPQPETVDGEHWANAMLVTLPQAAGGLPRRSSPGWERLMQRVLHTGPAIVHLHGLWDAGSFAAADLVRRRGMAFVVSPRGMLEPWALGQKRLKKRLFLACYLRGLLATTDLLHATSESEADSLRALGFRQPIAVVANGIDCTPALPRAEPCDGRARRLLYLGRMHVKKGLENLLRAWALVRPAGWLLSIAGLDEDGYASRLHALAAALELGSSVEFPGPKLGPEKWRYLASGTAFVHPSFSENFGIAVAEAMAAGLPVIATVGTPWQMLPVERCGWWVHPTTEALAGVIGEVTAADDATLRAMGARGKAYAATAFDWSAIGRDMADCYDWLSGLREPPRCIRFT